LSSAQLAAIHPVSGGTYEYGYRFLGSYWGFSAGWLFLLAKSASAATAIIGTTSYAFIFLGLETNPLVSTTINILVLIFLTWLVSGGIKRSNQVNIIIVSLTLTGLFCLVFIGLTKSETIAQPAVFSVDGLEINHLFYATALMFVAFTGYGRIATLGEEVIEPRKTIPKAIILTMTITLILYALVAYTAIVVMGIEGFGNTISHGAAPLVQVAEFLGHPVLVVIISFAAITAMIGVLLNLILGISRVVLGMSRRNDLPNQLSFISAKNGSPVSSVWFTGVLILILVLIGDIRITWSFSAFTVLGYYAITNLAALKIPADLRLYSPVISIIGLFGCLFLAFFVEPRIWMTGILLLFTGLLWHYYIGRAS
jgi:APA family basic amino acid/polyamine antiporter